MIITGAQIWSKFTDNSTQIWSLRLRTVKELAVWCSLNNLELNTLKTVEMIVNFRRNPPYSPPLTIMNSTVTAVESFRFLGTTISQDLKWDNHIESIMKKAQQRLYFLRQLRKFNLPQELLIQFCSGIIESVLRTSIMVWFSSTTKSDLRTLLRVVRTAERIIGTTLRTLQELYLSRVSKRAGKLTLDPSHPAQWSALQSSKYQNDQTQKQFLSPSNPYHEHMTLNVEHTTLLYNYLFTTHAYIFLFKFAHVRPHT